MESFFKAMSVGRVDEGVRHPDLVMLIRLYYQYFLLLYYHNTIVLSIFFSIVLSILSQLQ